MEQIALLEATADLPRIVEQVRRTGRPVTFTKDGQPYVDLVPHGVDPAPRRPKSHVLADLAALRLELPKSSADQIRADIEEGRR